jgi:carboxyl-terminal processing protease
MKNRLIILYFLLMSLTSCNEDGINPSQGVRDDLNEVIDIMEKHSIMRTQIDWMALRNKVIEKAGTVEKSAQILSGIREALTILDDNHSSFSKSGSIVYSDNWIHCEHESNFSKIIPENIGYVKIFHFAGGVNSAAAISFAQEIQDQIREADHAGITGWIVDLRENGGGNMWPMLAGIGPVLGEGIVGYFVNAGNGTSTWSYRDGSSYFNGTLRTPLEDAYELINPNPKVAVLLDNEVASSGEAIAIAFIGRDNTKSFGTATCGKSTAIDVFTFSDNSQLNLAIANMADRNLTAYGGQIIPDEEANADNIMQKAIDWIEEK